MYCNKQDHAETKAQLEKVKKELTDTKKESHKRKKLLMAQQQLIHAGSGSYNKVVITKILSYKGRILPKLPQEHTLYREIIALILFSPLFPPMSVVEWRLDEFLSTKFIRSRGIPHHDFIFSYAVILYNSMLLIIFLCIFVLSKIFYSTNTHYVELNL